jgi:hypothetical protein
MRDQSALAVGEQRKGVLASNPLRMFAFVLPAWIAVVTSSIGLAAATTPFDPKPWLEDLEQTREACHEVRQPGMGCA